ncbi:MAG TPA: response regulator transcription factor, partial [Anaerolineae bacterium]|nr:response regulator transcription factor [Anaerolineae bacterium]
AAILLGEQMTTSMAISETEALHELDRRPPDAMIVSIAAPGDWQVQLCAQIRERMMVPLLVLGSREQGATLARCLDLGADAHILSPCTGEVLLAQLYALLRRAGLARPGLERKYDIGTLAIDLFAREVRVGGEPVKLTPTEFEILRCLFGNSGRAISYRNLVRQAQGYDCSTEEARSLLKVHIHNLRQKIEPVPERPVHILNVRGFGYLFERRRHPRDSTGAHARQTVLTES